MTDDAIREIHGVHARRAGDTDLCEVRIREREELIILDRNMHDVALTPWQARYLAAKLYRLSRRIRQRTEMAA